LCVGPELARCVHFYRTLSSASYLS
jgi:hypothetical protein